MIHFKFVGIKDMHNIYYLGLSGERSLPFGLLVYYCGTSVVVICVTCYWFQFTGINMWYLVTVAE